MATLTDELASAIAELEDEKVLDLVQTRLDSGTSPLEIVGNLQQGMTEVGMRFEAGTYFLSELVMCGEIMKDAMNILEPRLAGADQKHRGSIVIGTVKGDVHDLGKNIVVMLLKGAGYNVIDLGIDVPGEKFIEAIRANGAPLVGMSVLLTACQEGMKGIIEEIRAAGLDTRVVIGGNYVDESVRDYVKADYFAHNASDAVKIADGIFVH
ncbi:Cobalamin (vitamin B12)-binding domain protein [Acididesulfobacillus acetoxydans]|uniref:Cobalamin (Vitamin B12)-binding domain protein n=1 Tax=Acididesulfobacillus acetoxydans TaxID=1561005 RepID=A0A8S0W7H8_9FIRM|nr:cobalamin-dependent protein [Acididesulfobacillus acetoxydans]CAA7600779.1 Cobalamin (vitamin B12)-binding domain protein [Acididesulfobacillus acetoxydans]CEJ08627.1 Dimethylamine corrinoid protein 3 [Acididesulfobacillus acetoxydans]